MRDLFFQFQHAGCKQCVFFWSGFFQVSCISWEPSEKENEASYVHASKSPQAGDASWILLHTTRAPWKFDSKFAPENKSGPKRKVIIQATLGGGFKYFLFSPLPGEMIQFDEHFFQMGWNHQLEHFSEASC